MLLTVFSAFSNEQIIEFLKQQVTDGNVFTDPETLKKQSFSSKISDERVT